MSKLPPKTLLALETGEVVAFTTDNHNYYNSQTLTNWIQINSLRVYHYDESEHGYTYNSEPILWKNLRNSENSIYIPKSVANYVQPYNIDNFKKSHKITCPATIKLCDSEITIPGAAYYALQQKRKNNDIDYSAMTKEMFVLMLGVSTHNYKFVYNTIIKSSTLTLSEVIACCVNNGIITHGLFREFFDHNSHKLVDVIEQLYNIVDDNEKSAVSITKKAFIQWCYCRDIFLHDLYQTVNLSVPANPKDARRRLEIFRQLAPSYDEIITWLVWLTQLGYHGKVPTDQIYEGCYSPKYTKTLSTARLMESVITLTDTTDAEYAKAYIKHICNKFV